MVIDPSEAQTRRLAVWTLLQDGQWHSTMEVNAKSVGGSEGCRRLRELRRQVEAGKRPGYAAIVCRKKQDDSTQYEYKLVMDNEPIPAKRGPVTSKPTSLSEQNRKLKDEIVALKDRLNRMSGREGRLEVVRKQNIELQGETARLRERVRKVHRIAHQAQGKPNKDGFLQAILDTTARV